ncbi:MAG: hypothetical protein JOZ16_02810 [Methylobacteriaceae bacterium]|nr:hypothetical protein [Methylobacteriaceae bacterium]
MKIVFTDEAILNLQSIAPRYGYLVYFKLYAEQDEARILFIQHPKQRRRLRDE